MTSKPRPRLITVDGIDGVGKSTQIAAIVDFLSKRGHDVLSVRDPGSSDIGKALRAILLESDIEMHARTEAMLFMASRCEMVEQTIRPALMSGRTVISDRFLLANVVYQSVGGQVSPDLLWSLGEIANGGCRPDVTILLDMPAEDAMKRIDGPADRMESRGVEYMEQVRQAFLKQLWRSSETTLLINANQPATAVTNDIETKLATILDKP